MAALGIWLESWTFDPVLGPALIAAAVAYLWAVRRVDARDPGHPWRRRCTVSFLSALALCWFVLLGPVGFYDDTFFWAHMVQHIALMMIIAPLLLLGSPVLLLLRACTPAVRRTWVLPVLRGRVLTFLTRPAVGWLVFAGVLVGTHFSPFYEFSLEHPAVHTFVEHPLYLTAALIYYYPLLPGNPGPRRVPYGVRAASLFGMMFPETMAGFFLYASTFVMFPFYLHAERPFGPSPLVDQQLGGALMWGGSMIIDTVWVSLAVMAWLRSEKRLAIRIDMQTLSELPALPGRPVTASTHAPRPADDELRGVPPRVRWLSGPALRLHAALALGLALSSAATWLEWTRAREGHAVAWVYTFEWPLFALLGTYLWWRLLHAEAKQRPRLEGVPETGAAADPDLLAWQAYLARLHQADPPGGPPPR